MEKKINLYEILIEMFKNGEPFYNEKDIKWAMKEACRQVLQLAAENATISLKNYNEETTSIVRFVDDKNTMFIDSSSILNTINQIE